MRQYKRDNDFICQPCASEKSSGADSALDQTQNNPEHEPNLNSTYVLSWRCKFCGFLTGDKEERNVPIHQNIIFPVTSAITTSGLRRTCMPEKQSSMKFRGLAVSFVLSGLESIKDVKKGRNKGS